MTNNDYIYFGLYDKSGTPNEKQIIYSSLIPTNARKITFKESEYGLNLSKTIERKDFPLVKDDGSEQKYHGWYALVPLNIDIVNVSENMGVTLNPNDLWLKKDDGSDYIMTIGKTQYKAMGSFNIAKTSNNWKLHITINKKS